MSLRILAGHAVALVVLALLPACGSRELLSNVSFSPEIISPNADGNSDVTHISYDLSRNAIVSIWLESSGGDRYTFRDARPRSAGEYGVQFSGVIDGRLLPNGEYRWIVEATDGAGQTQAVDGRLAISGGESTAPQITGFGVYPPLFTPNRDGISDRATINVSLNKPASLYVTLQNALCAGSAFPPEGQSDLDCTPYPVSEKASTREARKPGEAGLHEFDYDAGVDLGADPPPDGDYVVTARAEDAVGQVAVVTGTLAIVDGGVPRAEIVDGEVSFSARSLLIGARRRATSTISIRTSTCRASPRSRARGASASTSIPASATTPSAGPSAGRKTSSWRRSKARSITIFRPAPAPRSRAAFALPTSRSGIRLISGLA